MGFCRLIDKWIEAMSSSPFSESAAHERSFVSGHGSTLDPPRSFQVKRATPWKSYGLVLDLEAL